MGRSVVTLRKLALNDWQAVHSWARLEEACRYQPWGPNTEDQTRAFVQTAVEAWSHAHQQRFVYIACFENELVGMGELHIRSHRHRQGEIAYIVHPRAWGRGRQARLPRAPAASRGRPWGVLHHHRPHPSACRARYRAVLEPGLPARRRASRAT
ncbi:GNAT family N-acetyltransferase [Streptomyces sp. 891-h]|nr:GNAT family N-acetyltransferase [Streptomyces sp. 891-h]